MADFQPAKFASTCLFVQLLRHLSGHLPGHLSGCLTGKLSQHVKASFSISVGTSIGSSVGAFQCMSICQSIRYFVTHFYQKLLDQFTQCCFHGEIILCRQCMSFPFSDPICILCLASEKPDGSLVYANSIDSFIHCSARSVERLQLVQCLE